MNFNRRQLLRGAAGLLVASSSLAVPERRVFALDQTMIPQPSGASPHVNVAPGRIVLDGVEYPVAGSMPMPGDTPVFDPSPLTIKVTDYDIWKYDIVRVDGQHWGWVVADPGDTQSDVLLFDLSRETLNYGVLQPIANDRIETMRDLELFR